MNTYIVVTTDAMVIIKQAERIREAIQEVINEGYHVAVVRQAN